MDERAGTRNVWVLAVTVGAAVTAIFTWFRILPLYLRELGADEREIGWALFAISMSFRVPQLAGGWLADRLGRKPIAVIATLVMACGYVAIGLARTWPLVTAAICVCWAVGAIQWPAIAALAADSVDGGRRGRAMGLLEAGSMVGVTLGPLIGAWACGEGESAAGAWKALLFGSAAVYVAGTLARQLLLREPERHPRAGVADGPLGSRLLWILLAVHALSFAVYFLTTDGPAMALYIKDERLGSASTVQYVGFAGGLAAIGSAVVSGWLADRIGPGRLIVLGSLATGALLIPFLAAGPATRTDLWLFGLLFVTGEAYLIGYAKLIVGAAPPGRSGFYIGLGGTAVGLGASWAMVAAGALYETSHRAPMIAAAVVQAAAILLALPFLRKRFN